MGHIVTVGRKRLPLVMYVLKITWGRAWVWVSGRSFNIVPLLVYPYLYCPSSYTRQGSSKVDGLPSVQHEAGE